MCAIALTWHRVHIQLCPAGLLPVPALVAVHPVELGLLVLVRVVGSCQGGLVGGAAAAVEAANALKRLATQQLLLHQ
jgi:hypothetical protein